jgi:hypothetical protein
MTVANQLGKKKPTPWFIHAGTTQFYLHEHNNSAIKRQHELLWFFDPEL